MAVLPAGAPFPREHGAWFMLLAPLGLGLAAPERPALPVAALLTAAALAAFLAQDAARRLWRGQRPPGLMGWLGVWATLAGAAGITLLVTRGSAPLVAIAGAGVAAFGVELGIERSRRRSLQAGSDLLAAAALALSAPAAVTLGGGDAASRGLWLWVLCFVFFTSAVAHVRLLLAWARLRRASLEAVRRAARPSLVVHTLLGAGVAGLLGVRRDAGALLVLLAFTPVVARGLMTAWRGHPETPRLKRVGLLEAVYATWFAVLTAVSMHV
jgi:hypothetical protein